MRYHGDLKPGDVLDFNFGTLSDNSTAGAMAALTSGTVTCYKANATTGTTVGVSMTSNFYGLAQSNPHHVRIDTGANSTFFVGASDYVLVLTAGTVGSTSVVGQPLGNFSILNRAPLMSTTTGRSDVNMTQVNGSASAASALSGFDTRSINATTHLINGDVIRIAGNSDVPTRLTVAFNEDGKIIASFQGNLTGGIGGTTNAATNAQVISAVNGQTSGTLTQVTTITGNVNGGIGGTTAGATNAQVITAVNGQTQGTMTLVATVTNLTNNKPTDGTITSAPAPTTGTITSVPAPTTGTITLVNTVTTLTNNTPTAGTITVAPAPTAGTITSAPAPTSGTITLVNTTTNLTNNTPTAGTITSASISITGGTIDLVKAGTITSAPARTAGTVTLAASQPLYDPKAEIANRIPGTLTLDSNTFAPVTVVASAMMNPDSVWAIATSSLTDAGSIGKALAAFINGVTSVGNWLRAMFRKSTPDTTALAEINISAGTFDATTDSLEAIRDRGDAAWAGSGTSSGLTAQQVRDAMTMSTSTGGSSIDTQLGSIAAAVSGFTFSGAFTRSFLVQDNASTPLQGITVRISLNNNSEYKVTSTSGTFTTALNTATYDLNIAQGDGYGAYTGTLAVTGDGATTITLTATTPPVISADQCYGQLLMVDGEGNPEANVVVYFQAADATGNNTGYSSATFTASSNANGIIIQAFPTGSVPYQWQRGSGPWVPFDTGTQSGAQFTIPSAIGNP